MVRTLRSALAVFTLAAVVVALCIIPAASAAGPFDKLNHVIVIYQENWSFDSLYGHFPAANGLDNAGPTTPQVSKDDQPYETLPQPLNTNFSPAVPDPRFPANMPVAAFDTTK